MKKVTYIVTVQYETPIEYILEDEEDPENYLEDASIDGAGNIPACVDGAETATATDCIVSDIEENYDEES